MGAHQMRVPFSAFLQEHSWPGPLAGPPRDILPPAVEILESKAGWMDGIAPLPVNGFSSQNTTPNTKNVKPRAGQERRL